MNALTLRCHKTEGNVPFHTDECIAEGQEWCLLYAASEPVACYCECGHLWRQHDPERGNCEGGPPCDGRSCTHGLARCAALSTRHIMMTCCRGKQ